ncbi:MAG: 4-hydroxy-tetrahydrodipicolinate reductase [Fimbriimonadaceae bacterium]|nr:4-hydroxy-tetrahydrodipicolinate reductase [Fimbriimonadaceae bacterium]
MIAGASGRMGREACLAIHESTDLELAGATAGRAAGKTLNDLVGEAGRGLVLESDLPTLLDRVSPDVVLDLTHHEPAMAHARAALERRIPIVVGASGLSQEDLAELARLTEDRKTSAAVIPNFALGAVLMMRFAEAAARWMPDFEIIELHHDGKKDAPSGTATALARRMSAAREAPGRQREESVLHEGARGAEIEGVRVHSVRLPGMLAHNEVLFGAPGEILTLRHDSTDRRGFMAGVLLSLRRVADRPGLTLGLEAYLDGL